MRIVRRAEWGARQPEEQTFWQPDQLKGVTVHWFGSPTAADTHAGCDDLLRSVQRTHQAGEYSDIAYNHAVCPHGIVYELRGFSVKTGANGTTYANDNYAAVVYMAGTGDPLTDEGKAGLTFAIGEWRNRGSGRDVKPHGHWTGSTCPGPAVRAWLERKEYERPLNPARRLAALRAWLLARKREGKSWAWIKKSANWREYVRLGGK